MASGYRPHTINPLTDKGWSDMDGLRQLAVAAQMFNGAFDGFRIHAASVALLFYKRNSSARRQRTLQ